MRARGSPRSPGEGMARTDVRAVTTRAPLEPNTVYWASTSMPADDVIVQPSAQRAASTGGQAQAIGPRRRRRATAWATPTAAPEHRPLDGQRTEVPVVPDGLGAGAEPGGQAGRRGDDPRPRRQAVAAQTQPLHGPEHGARDGPAEHRRGKLSTGPTSTSAASPPAGNPRNVGIQRSTTIGQRARGVPAATDDGLMGPLTPSPARARRRPAARPRRDRWPTCEPSMSRCGTMRSSHRASTSSCRRAVPSWPGPAPGG